MLYITVGAFALIVACTIAGWVGAYFSNKKRDKQLQELKNEIEEERQKNLDHTKGTIQYEENQNSKIRCILLKITDYLEKKYPSDISYQKAYFLYLSIYSDGFEIPSGTPLTSEVKREINKIMSGLRQ